MATSAEAPKKVDTEPTSTQTSTPAKKELEVRTVKIGTYEIHYVGGGEVPAVLQGHWNRKVVAHQAIEKYKTLKAGTNNGKGKN